MASSYNAGRPLPLVVSVKERTETGPRFELDAEVLKQMMDLDKLSSAKVAVISVTGAFRTGKSFLLNFFLRYLRALSRGDTRDWILSEDQLDDGFHWRSGIERDTTGILIWSEPFFIRKPDGQEVAVLLMDTQGAFDHQSTQRDCATIFGFSTLLSSVQIFNISQNIQETDLQHLRLFVEFASMARESKDKKVLQHLWFLTRDWQNSHEHDYGSTGGQEYLDKVLACDSRKPKENQELRLGIKRYFERASCCLLPHPGKAVAAKDFRGEIHRLDPEFVDEMEKFIPVIASPQALVVKKVNGTELPGKELFKFFDIYFEAFKNGKMPTPRNIFDATVEMANITAAQGARQMFEDSLDPDLHDDEFFDILEVLKQQSLEYFLSNCMQPESAATKKTLEKLQEEIQGLLDNKKFVRRLQSRTLSADRKNQQLQHEIGRLQLQNMDVLQQMENMEENFRRTEEEIRRQSVSKDEMDRLLQDLSMQHLADKMKIQADSEKLVGKVNQLAEMNSQLKNQLSVRQQEAQRSFERREQLRQSEVAELQSRISQLESRKPKRSCVLM
ncbi:hypothetical protein BOX15_Mlig034242g1 [Macrostomum lignano]|uniref:GB1/RHD3-type G domain-containing protein n=1 Tax=Macrostomum lignano TaxID=282301 RepID=A0A267DKS3_9PLAT|nr:hypothetical protein BOX15_Mlig034242g1 [Macrostomum lignano]